MGGGEERERERESKELLTHISAETGKSRLRRAEDPGESGSL